MDDAAVLEDEFDRRIARFCVHAQFDPAGVYDLSWPFYEIMEDALQEKAGKPRKRRASKREERIVAQVKASTPMWSDRLKQEAPLGS